MWITGYAYLFQSELQLSLGIEVDSVLALRERYNSSMFCVFLVRIADNMVSFGLCIGKSSRVVGLPDNTNKARTLSAVGNSCLITK